MAVLYRSTKLYVFTMNMEMFDDYLISGQQANPALVNNTNYYLNRIKLRVAINDAKNSVIDMNSISNAQSACDRGAFLIENQSLFY